MHKTLDSISLLQKKEENKKVEYNYCGKKFGGFLKI
jgi:hypothetical protein